MTVISLAEWRPDAAELNSAYTGDLFNVLAADGSYVPFKQLEAFTVALESKPLGDFMARQLDGTISIFAGTADKLWRLDNTTLAWEDVSQALTTYSATEDAPWSLNQFGNFVLAANQNDDPQIFELGVDTEFRDCGGSPPRAGIIKIAGDFVFLEQLTSNLDRVHWSELNNAEGWTPGVNNSDFQTFPDGGVVQGSTEATNPLIFQERAIRRATFVPGSVEIFTFQKIHDLRGAKSARSIASRGSYAFYADEGGFFQISPDGSLVNIGFEKVDKTVFEALSASSISRIAGAVDPFFSRVYWAVDYSGTGAYDTLLIYDWNLSHWTQAGASINSISPAATVGYTLDGFDAVSASLDALPFSLDSKVWQGGAPVMSAFNLNNELCFFSGANAEATVTTQEMGDVSGGVVRTTSTYPVVDTDQVFVSYGLRFRRTDTVTWLPEQIPSSNTGRVRKNGRARFLRYKMRIPAGTDWHHIQALDAKTEPAGDR